MDNELITIRLIHIVPGALWVGTAFFASFIMEPRLNSLGPEIAASANRAIGKVMGPFLTLLGLVTIGAGFSLLSRTPGRSADDLFNNDWGWAIGIGVIAANISFLLGFATAYFAIRSGRVLDSVEGAPTPEQAAQIERMASGVRWSGRLSAIGVIIAVGAMSSARFV